jgi:hypothetical protein
MTQDTILRETLTKHLPRRRWIPIADIYTIVERRMLLDAEDRTCSGSRRPDPRWHTNVRRILNRMRREGRLLSRTSA